MKTSLEQHDAHPALHHLNTDHTPALAFEHPEPEAMHRPPRNPAEPLLNRHMLWRTVFVTVFLVAGALGVFLQDLERGMPAEVARTARDQCAGGEIFYLFNCRRLTAPVVG